MGIQQKLLVIGILLMIVTWAGPGSPDAGPARTATMARTFPLRVEVDALGISWTGKITIDELGAVRLSADPGLRWEEPSPSDDAGPGLLTAVRRCLRFVGSLIDRPAPLARAGLSLVAGH